MTAAVQSQKNTTCEVTECHQVSHFNERIIVCDIGAHSIKMGLIQNDSTKPTVVVPSIMGTHFNKSSLAAVKKNNDTSIVFGRDALRSHSKGHLIKIRQPLGPKGSIQDIGAMKALLRYSLSKLNIKIEDGSYKEYRILLAKPDGMRDVDVGKIFQFFFHELQFGSVSLDISSAFLMYSMGGIKTGLTVEIGEYNTRIFPICLGCTVPNADRTLGVGGRTVARRLGDLLRKEEHQVDPDRDLEHVRDAVHNVCYVALDKAVDDRLAEETTILMKRYTLPNRTKISLDKERFEAAEVLFDPKLVGVEGIGLIDAIRSSINVVDIDCRADLWDNVILSGGAAHIAGIQKRVVQELQKIRPRNGKSSSVRVHLAKNHAVFRGASIFADCVADDSNFWVSRSEFDKHGIESVLALVEKCHRARADI